MRAAMGLLALTAATAAAAPAPKAGHAIYMGEMLFKLEETAIKIQPTSNGERIVSFMVMSRLADNASSVIVSSIVANCGIPRYFQVADAIFVDNTTRQTGKAMDLIMVAPKPMDVQSPQWTYTDLICSGKVKPASVARKKKGTAPRANTSPACPGAPGAKQATNPVDAILATVKDLKSELAGCESDLGSAISSGRVTRP